MTKLTSEHRNELSSKEFALPGERKYPVEDKSHAAAAKSRATEEYNKGHISKVTEERINRAANRKLHGVKEHELEYWG